MVSSSALNVPRSVGMLPAQGIHVNKQFLTNVNNKNKFAPTRSLQWNILL